MSEETAECPCGVVFETTKSRVDAGRGRYCSKVCMYRYRVMPKRSHGLAGTYLYNTWDAMVGRCTDPTHPSWSGYGARGVRVHEAWLDFETFASWVRQNLGARPDGCSLDRYPNGQGNYEPGNVRWATRKQQAHNREGWSRSTSRYKGVSWDGVNSKWKAQILISGKNKNLGRYTTEAEAAQAYNVASLEHFGSDGPLNIITTEGTE